MLHGFCNHHSSTVLLFHSVAILSLERNHEALGRSSQALHASKVDVSDVLIGHHESTTILQVFLVLKFSPNSSICSRLKVFLSRVYSRGFRYMLEASKTLLVVRAYHQLCRAQDHIFAPRRSTINRLLGRGHLGLFLPLAGWFRPLPSGPLVFPLFVKLYPGPLVFWFLFEQPRLPHNTWLGP